MSCHNTDTYVSSTRNKFIEELYNRRFNITPTEHKIILRIGVIIITITYAVYQVIKFLVMPNQWDQYPTFIIKLIVTFLPAILIFLFSHFVLQRSVKAWKYIDIITFLIGLLLVIGLEMLAPNYAYDTPGPIGFLYFWDCYQQLCLTVAICFYLRKWFARIMFILVICIYFCIIRIQTTNDKLKIILVAGYFIYLSVMIYQLEKQYKIAFFRQCTLLEKEKNWKNIITVLPEGIMIINRQKRCKYHNNAMDEIFCSKKHQKSNFFNCESNNNSDTSMEIDVNMFLKMITDIKARESIEVNRLEEYRNKLFQAQIQPLHDVIDEITEQKKKIKEKEFEYATLADQIDFLISYGEKCKTKEICWNSIGEESKFMIFDAKYETKSIEIKLAFTCFNDEHCLLIIFRDTSHRDMITILEENDKYKGLILASVAHEFRTPINSSTSFIQTTIEDSRIPQDIKENLLIPAKRVLNILLSLTNDILDYSQINSQKIKLSYQKTNIRQVISDTMGLIEIQAKKKNIKLILEYSVEAPQVITTDSTRFTQILLNLLSNALKFTFKGTIRVDAYICNLEEKLLAISVTDSGIGIKSEDMPKLFTEYVKIDNGDRSTINSSGCGLGLTIANRLAKVLARGDIDAIKVDSTFGKGSKFTFFVQDKCKEPYFHSENDDLCFATTTDPLTCPYSKDRNQDFDKNFETDLLISFGDKNHIKSVSCVCNNSMIARGIPKFPLFNSTAPTQIELKKSNNDVVALNHKHCEYDNENKNKAMNNNKPNDMIDQIVQNEYPKIVLANKIRSCEFSLSNININKDLGISKEYINIPNEKNVLGNKVENYKNIVNAGKTDHDQDSTLDAKNRGDELIVIPHKLSVDRKISTKNFMVNEESEISHSESKPIALEFNNTKELIIKNIDDCHCPQILIVDDDAMNIFALEQMLDSIKCTHTCAYHGQEALEKVKQRLETNLKCPRNCQAFQLIFMDCSMPIMDGYEATKQIKKIVPIRIIGCTGHEGNQHENLCLNSGMDEVISKPIKKEKLIKLLKKYNLLV